MDLGNQQLSFHCIDMIKTKYVEQLARASRKSVACICEVCGAEYFEIYRNITRSQFADKYCRECRVEVKRHHLSQLKTDFYKSAAGEKTKRHLSLITKEQAKSRIGAFSAESRRKQAHCLSVLHKDCEGPYAQHIFKVTRGSAHPNWRDDKEGYEEYKSKVYSETQKWDLHSLEGADMRGLCGTPAATQLDHKLSIYYGYSHNIEPKIVGHICNLQFVSWKDNRAKGTKCSISLSQLLAKIEKYNEASPTTISKESRIQANSKRAASLISEKDEDIVWSHAKV